MNLVFFISHYTDFFGEKVFLVSYICPIGKIVKNPIYKLGSNNNVDNILNKREKIQKEKFDKKLKLEI